MRILFVSTALILAACSWSEDSKPDPKMPRDAQVLLDSYTKTAAKLEDDYRHKLNGEREKLYAALDKSSKEAGKRGDIDGAISIKSEMKKIMDQVQKEDATNLPGEKNDQSQMVGRWSIRYTNNLVRVYEITADGHLQYNGQTFKVEPDSDGSGVVVRMGSANTLDHLKLNKTELAVEHFNPADTYPKGTPDQTGVGTRMKDEPKK